MIQLADEVRVQQYLRNSRKEQKNLRKTMLNPSWFTIILKKYRAQDRVALWLGPDKKWSR